MVVRKVVRKAMMRVRKKVKIRMRRPTTATARTKQKYGRSAFTS
jgi:hypothetical protein